MFLVNSRLGLITAAPSRSTRRDITLLGPPLSRSYGGNVPSSLTRVLSSTLVFSTCLPVSVLVRALRYSLEVFLGSVGSITSTKASPHNVSGLNEETDLPISSPYALVRGQPTPRLTYPPASPHRCVPEGTRIATVQEYQPVVHRLRLSASA